MYSVNPKIIGISLSRTGYGFLPLNGRCITSPKSVCSVTTLLHYVVDSNCVFFPKIVGGTLDFEPIILPTGPKMGSPKLPFTGFSISNHDNVLLPVFDQHKY